MTPAELASFPTWQEVQLDYLRKLLEACGGDVTLAARVSCVGRATLYRKVRALGLRTARQVNQQFRSQVTALLEQAESRVSDR